MAAGARVAATSATRAPLHACVDAGAARVDLERVGEHDEDDDGEAANGTRCGGGVHGDDVAADVVAVGKVAGDAGEDVETAGAADGGEDYGAGAEVRVVCDFVQDGEHLPAC